MSTFADRTLAFLSDLKFAGVLPEGVKVMNPFGNNTVVFHAVTEFYRKFYNDNLKRHLILGINPGRLGAGTTGIPFTDTIRLQEKCGISIPGIKTYEPSSAFIYEMIDRYGGPEKFYNDFFISAVCPLGFTSKGVRGNDVNFNYYDSRELTDAVYSFIIHSLQRQIELGIEQDHCFCLGTGRNFKFLRDINNEWHFFNLIEPLEHPRFIMQYRKKKKEFYLLSYVNKLEGVGRNPEKR